MPHGAQNRPPTESDLAPVSKVPRTEGLTWPVLYPNPMPWEAPVAQRKSDPGLCVSRAALLEATRLPVSRAWDTAGQGDAGRGGPEPSGR